MIRHFWTRLARLETLAWPRGEEHGAGIASLLALTRRGPTTAVDHDEDLDANMTMTGLARLLWEVRQAEKSERVDCADEPHC